MKSPHSFLVTPIDNKRYVNTKEIGGIDFIISTSEENHKASNRFATVVETPLGYKGEVKKGDTLANVAMRHIMSKSELCDLNHMHGGHHKLMTGQVLLVKPIAQIDLEAETAKRVEANSPTTTSRSNVLSDSSKSSSIPALFHQEPVKQRVYFCTTNNEKIAGILTISFQLLIFEPDSDDPIVQKSKSGLLKYQFCMDVRDLIGSCEISHTTNTTPSPRESYEEKSSSSSSPTTTIKESSTSQP